MTNRIKVLIGNDAADCGMAWAGALKGAGMYAITRHCDGNAVLSSIKSEAPDVAVLEAKMPYCDAVEVIRRLKTEKKYCPNVLIVSGTDDPRLERDAINAGRGEGEASGSAVSGEPCGAAVHSLRGAGGSPGRNRPGMRGH